MPHPNLERLLAIIARLRAPDGCPWDREQTEVSMAPHLLEEVYEAIDALVAQRADKSCEELGDVLMNVLMIAQIASESGRYDVDGVAGSIADKLVRRHPHVFGDVQARDTEQVLANWETIKRQEGQGAGQGTLTGVPSALPALLMAFRVGEKAARTGFDWPDAEGPRRKLTEELAEFDAAIAAGDAEAATRELGDVLFSAVNVARHAGVNPEMALRGTVAEFMQRFAYLEAKLGDRLISATLAEKEALWQEAKGRLR